MRIRCTLVLFLLFFGNNTFAQDVQTIKCDADTTKSYSLCVPSNYSRAQKYPVVFLFDPGGHGRNAVAQYQKAATDYGFILIASNNSRNGPISESLNAANAMFGDAFKKYSLDERHIYLAGHSGGARVATTIALQATGIAGVIACSAGFGEPIPTTKLSWTFAGTAGDRDFNYVEMQETTAALQKTGSAVNLQIFAGPHRWPPVDVFFNALFWSYLKHKPSAADNGIIAKYKTLVMRLINEIASPSEKVAVYQQYLSISPDAGFEADLKQLQSSKPYLDEHAQLTKLIVKESAFQKEISNALQLILTMDNTQMQTKGWWRGHLASLNKMLLSHSNADSSYVFRQKSFITANASESFGHYYTAKRYETAGELLTVSEAFEPDNTMVCYRRALLSATAKDEINTLYALQQAIKNGYSNKTQLSKQPEFEFLKSDKRFLDLLK